MHHTVVEEFTSTPEGMASFQQERAILEVTMLIRRLLKERAMSKAELAAKLGKTPSYITQLLNGRTNMTLRTISDVFVALDRTIQVAAGPLNGSGTAPQFQASAALEWKSYAPISPPATVVRGDIDPGRPDRPNLKMAG